MNEIKSKLDAYEKLEQLLEYTDVATVIKYMTDYFSTQDVIDFIEHIEKEQA